MFTSTLLCFHRIINIHVSHETKIEMCARVYTHTHTDTPLPIIWISAKVFCLGFVMKCPNRRNGH